MPKLSFKGYSWAAKKLRSEAVDEYMTRGEITELLELSDSRFLILVTSAVFKSLNNPPQRRSRRKGSGSSIWYEVEGFANALEHMKDPEYQIKLMGDFQNLNKGEFVEIYGKEKGEIFDDDFIPLDQNYREWVTRGLQY